MIRPLVTLNKMTCAICPCLRPLHGPFTSRVIAIWRSSPAVTGMLRYVRLCTRTELGRPKVRTSSRLHHLATRVSHRAGGFFTGDQAGNCKHVLRSGFGSVLLADEDVRHQFMIAGAIAHTARL